MNRSMRVLIQFLWRDVYALRKTLLNQFINYAVIQVILLSFTFGYVVPQIMATGEQTTRGATSFFMGEFLFVCLPLVFVLNIRFMKDFFQSRYIDYQRMHLSPSWILLERLIFLSVAGIAIGVFYIPMSKLVMGRYFDFTSMSYGKFFIAFYASFLVCAAQSNCMAAVVSRFDMLPKIWMRVWYPLIQLAGLHTTWLVMHQAAPRLSYLLLLNPFLYVTESLRCAVLGPEGHFPYGLSVLALIGFTIVLHGVGCVLLKRKLGAI